jgi:hypothetical protein
MKICYKWKDGMQTATLYQTDTTKFFLGSKKWLKCEGDNSPAQSAMVLNTGNLNPHNLYAHKHILFILLPQMGLLY